jgi:uncharacterized membrane protein YqiK
MIVLRGNKIELSALEVEIVKIVCRDKVPITLEGLASLIMSSALIEEVEAAAERMWAAGYFAKYADGRYCVS